MAREDIESHIEGVIDGENTTEPTGRVCFCGCPVPEDYVSWSVSPEETIEYCSEECRDDHREHIFDY